MGISDQSSMPDSWHEGSPRASHETLRRARPALRPMGDASPACDLFSIRWSPVRMSGLKSRYPRALCSEPLEKGRRQRKFRRETRVKRPGRMNWSWDAPYHPSCFAPNSRRLTRVQDIARRKAGLSCRSSA